MNFIDFYWVGGHSEGDAPTHGVLGFMMGLMDFAKYEKNIDAIGAGLSKMGFADVAASLSLYAKLFAIFDRSHRSIWSRLRYLVEYQTDLSLPPWLSGWLRPCSARST